METKTKFFALLFLALFGTAQAANQQFQIRAEKTIPQIAKPGTQTGNIAIEDDIYLVVNTQALGVTVKAVRLYTDASKTTLVDSYEGCAEPVCEYNLVLEGLSTGTYFVEAETYSNTFFSNWVSYE